MNATTINLERTSRSLTFNGQSIDVEELNVQLPFSRKPADLSEVGECGSSGRYRIFVTETRAMSATEFDAFAARLLVSHAWLAGKGGYVEDGRLCVEINAPGRPTLFVDPSGGDYARYVARIA